MAMQLREREAEALAPGQAYLQKKRDSRSARCPPRRKLGKDDPPSPASLPLGKLGELLGSVNPTNK